MRPSDPKQIVCGAALYSPGLGLLTDAGVCMSGGRILAAGTRRDLTEAYPGATVELLSDRLLLPAMRDAHDHGRGVSPAAFGAPDCALETWIPSLGAVSSDAYLCALYDGLRLASSGVSAVLHSHNPGRWGSLDELTRTARGYNDAGIRVVLCPPFVDQNNLIYMQRDRFADGLCQKLRQEFGRRVCDAPMSLEQYFSQIEALTDALSDRIETGMVGIQLHPAGFQWVSDDALTAMQQYAQEHNLRIHMHMLETKYQRRWAQECFGNSGVRHLYELGLLSPRLSLAHMVWADPDDWRLLAAHGVSVAVNSSSNLRLHSGIMPLGRALRAGVDCAIGLDGCALDDDQDFLRELRLTGLNASDTGVDAGIRPETLLGMATQGGAELLDLHANGTLAPGQQADVLCIDLKRLREPYAAPQMDPLSLLLLRGTRAAVDRLYVGGKLVVRNGKNILTDEGFAAQRLAGFLQTQQCGESDPMSQALVEAIRRFYRHFDENGGSSQ